MSKDKNARAKRAKILFSIVKYANLWGFCCRRRRGCLSSLLLTEHAANGLVEVPLKYTWAMKDLLWCVQFVVKTLNSEISRCHLVDYVKEHSVDYVKKHAL